MYKHCLSEPKISENTKNLAEVELDMANTSLEIALSGLENANAELKIKMDNAKSLLKTLDDESIANSTGLNVTIIKELREQE